MRKNRWGLNRGRDHGPSADQAGVEGFDIVIAFGLDTLVKNPTWF